jgi:SAM-dependent MidA family methyltransferase
LNVERWASLLGMKSGNHQLIEFIRARIEEGPVSFAWFMEQALYHPEHGYYSSGRAKLGRQGDYFTNVSVGPIFGRLLASQVNEIWEQLGKPDDFVVVEQGAHDGEFARDVLTASLGDSPACFDKLRYRIVEPSRPLREGQTHCLTTFAGRVEWLSSVETLEPFVGIVFANELLDSMPLHLVVVREEEPHWVEKYVDWQNDQFVLVERPITDPRLEQQLKILPPLPAGFELEINLAALEWIDNMAKKLRRGYVLIVDYGFGKQELSALRHRAGTLQCRAEHRLIDSPFDCVGNRDITAHVYWTGVAEHAQNRNLDIAGFADQHHFLTGIISEHQELLEPNDPKIRRQLQTLLHPEMMGRSFQVLGLSRGIDPGVTLSGFKFARPPRQELGIV